MSLSQINNKQLTIEIPTSEQIISTTVYNSIPPAPRANNNSRVPRFFMNLSPQKIQSNQYNLPHLQAFSPT
tara:strand:+ start:389 stop:601 length:213 start_codon:yes stop_codon:yes gene_type:complete